MTDLETLFNYRLNQAEETLADAQRMLEENMSSRSVINRAYYAMFYAVLALFLKAGVNARTSKHTGIISLFDKELVHTGKLDKRYSRMLHETFDLRQEGDYKELVQLTPEDATEAVSCAQEFLKAVRGFLSSAR